MCKWGGMMAGCGVHSEVEHQVSVQEGVCQRARVS